MPVFSTPPPQNHLRERGSAIVWALFCVIITTGMVVTHATNLRTKQAQIEARYQQATLAENFAQSGLSDALSWFLRRSDQPVTEFVPQLDESANPPVIETIDPTLGLVREFEVRGNLWGRYEVRRSEAYDVSEERGHSTEGSAWRVAARGYVYRRVDPNKGYSEWPNRIIGSSALSQEIRRFETQTPAEAAISVGDPSNTVIGDGTSVLGEDKAALAFPDNVPDEIEIHDGAEVQGSPQKMAVPGYDGSVRTVLGMTIDEFRRVSDVVVRSISELPGQPSGQMVFVPGDLVLGADTVLNGRMLLVVDGDLVVESGSEPCISGMVYVTGDARIEGGLRLEGTLILGGGLTLSGEAAEIRYDPIAVTAVRTSAALYRLFGSPMPVDSETGVDLGTAEGMLTKAKFSLENLEANVINMSAKDMSTAALSGVAVALSELIDPSQVSGPAAFEAIKSEVAGNMLDIAILIGQSQVDAANLDDVRTVAVSAVKAAQILTENAIASARSRSEDVTTAEEKMALGDAAMSVPETSVTDLGIDWYKYLDVVNEYKGAWESVPIQ